jgi:hypothetical protein
MGSKEEFKMSDFQVFSPLRDSEQEMTLVKVDIRINTSFWSLED